MANNNRILNLNNFYYLKPFVPRDLQIFLRRKIVQAKLAKYSNTWPIDKDAAVPPDNWQGWPKLKRFAFVVTHDVETKEGMENCLKIADMEERMGFRSSFNFVAKDYETPVELRNNLKKRGFEIGIHGLYHNEQPFMSRDVFTRQKPEIVRFMKDWGSVGFRSPSMYHNLDYVHELGVEYDASTFDTDPFEPQPDGLGTIFPKWMSGPNNEAAGYVELPYTLPQDFLLFVLLRQRDIHIWKKKLDWVAENGGMALTIVHPDYVYFDSASKKNAYSISYYEQLLEYVSTKYRNQYWHALPREVANFWSSSYGAQKISA